MNLAQASRQEIHLKATKSVLNELRDLGLSTYEAQAYLALIQGPNLSATDLCNDTSIPDSKIYFALEELQRKGFVVVSEGVPRRYRALRPKDALGKLRALITQEYESQIGRLNQLAVALEPLYAPGEREDVELAYVVKGFDNVLGRMVDALKSARQEAVIFIPNANIYDRLEKTISNLRRNGVKVKLALPPKIRKQLHGAEHSEIRTMSPNCHNCWLAVVDNKTAISSSEWMTERCHAILTQDPVLVAVTHEYFENPRCCT